MKVLEHSMLLVATTVLVASGCAAEPPPPPSNYQASSVQQGTPGGTAVDSTTITAIVDSIDRDKRELTLLLSDGSKQLYPLGPEVKNFDQIKVGDHVKAEVRNTLELSLEKAGGTSTESVSGSYVTAAPGEKPGVVATVSTQVTGKIVNMDKTARTVTLEFPNGTMAKYPVRSDVDMSKANFGDQVVMRNTELRSIVVVSP